MVQLLVLLCCCDDVVLRWPRGGGRGVPRWQPLAAQLLVLTPYFFGGVAKLSADWLVRHEPIRTWAPESAAARGSNPARASQVAPRASPTASHAPAATRPRSMLGKMDEALGGWLDRHLPAVDVVPPFAALICYGGTLFDLCVPLLLLRGGAALRWGVALPAALAFNACNKARAAHARSPGPEGAPSATAGTSPPRRPCSAPRAQVWFGLGVFPYVMLASLLLFLVPSSPPPLSPRPPPSSAAPPRQSASAARSKPAAAATSLRARRNGHAGQAGAATADRASAAGPAAPAGRAPAAPLAPASRLRRRLTTACLCAYAAVHVALPLRHVGGAAGFESAVCPL